jgi:predicted GNAT family N-acyltransferase
MPADEAFSIVQAQLPDELPVIHTIRQQVFVEEQHIPGHLEWDGQDPSCCHVVALDPHHQAIGTGRISPDGRIGRMAVLKPWRSKGIGSAILDALLELARTKGHHSVYLHAQLDAAGLYRQAGFRQRGQSFREAGIEHITMVKTLACPGTD